MLLYITRRILQGLLVLVLISLLTFVVLRLMPGDPAYLLLGEGEIRISEEQMEAIRRRWGLDRPYHEQYLVWAWNLLRGDFGDSLIRTGVPVRQMIFETIPVTIKLNVISLGLAFAVAIPAGIIAGVRRNSPFDYTTAVGSTLGVALPNFWLGLMLIVLFALYVPRWFGDLPLVGRIPPFGLKSWQGYILPILVLTTEQMAVLTRVMRAATLEVLSQDYVRTAYAKGLPNTTRASPPRGAQCAAAGSDGDRFSHRLYSQWHDRRRDRFCHPRHWPSLHRFGLSPRLPGRSVPGRRAGRPGRGREPAYRPDLRHHRSAYSYRVVYFNYLFSRPCLSPRSTRTCIVVR